MNQALQLIYPTVDLFLYDLHDGLGQSTEEIDQNRQDFWQRIYGDNLNEDKLATFKGAEGNFASYIELLGSQVIERFKHPFNGYYYPVKLGDTYALQVDCSGKQDDWEWLQLPLQDKLREIKEIILEHTQNNRGKLGQSWLIWGQMALPGQNPEETAKECYEGMEIVPQAKWERDLTGKGKFRGATLFELELPDASGEGFNRNHHVLICLFPNEQNLDEIHQYVGKLYPELIRLFHNRNKVLWVYEQSRQIKAKLKSEQGEIQGIVDSLPKLISKPRLNLRQLQQDLADALAISYTYEANLGYLQEQGNTIELNTKNYLNRAKTIAKQGSENNLQFLTKFYQYAKEKCLTQVNSDYQALGAGLKPLENFIKTIEGIIEIEQTKNERSLNKTIAVASVGIGAASISAAIFDDKVEKIIEYYLPQEEQLPSPLRGREILPQVTLWANPVVTFSLSLFMGLIFAGITSLLVRKGK